MPTPRPAKRRWWIIALLIVAALTIVAGTWIVAVTFQSPAQRQAAAEPPPAQPVVVEVTRGDLLNRTTMMVEATLDNPRSEVLPMGEGTSVVTGVGVPVGESLTAGAVITWVNDRPVFALGGRFPFFRDIGEGDSGEDVRMFQQALADIGYGIAPDGNFGPFTASCVRDLYQQAGATAPTREIEAEAPAAKLADGEDRKAVAEPAAPVAKKQIVMPKSEVVVLPALPVKVAATPAVGAVLTGDTAKLGLSGQGVVLWGGVPGATAARLSPGIEGTAQAGNETIAVKIASVKSAAEAANPEDPVTEEEGDPSQSTVTFEPVKGKFPDEWAGNPQVLITLDLTPPLTDVLLVPQRAIAADATGKETILLQQADASFAQVAVDVQGCIGGMCAIADSDSIAQGALLRVDR